MVVESDEVDTCRAVNISTRMPILLENDSGAGVSNGHISYDDSIVLLNMKVDLSYLGKQLKNGKKKIKKWIFEKVQ